MSMDIMTIPEELTGRGGGISTRRIGRASKRSAVQMEFEAPPVLVQVEEEPIVITEIKSPHRECITS
jgi:hypothetical protein